MILSMRIESNIFVHNSMIPAQYTCDGDGKRVPLKIFGVPESAKSLALIVDDPDAPNGDFVHWIIWNIDPKTSIIESDDIPKGAIEGHTNLNKPGWVAPCPPSGTHHYNFKLFALDRLLSISEKSTKTDLMHAMDGYVIENATLAGLYERKKIKK